MRYDGPMSPYGCGRAVRRGCGCLVGLLVILVLLACMLGYGVSRGLVPSAHAAGPSDPTATQLAPAVPEAPRTTTPRGVFYAAHVSVTVASRQVKLAGSPDGTGQLCTDDRATLTFRPVSGDSFVWQHTFHQNTQTGIYCIPPVDLTGQLAPGAYDVEVQLEDVVPYTYSSTAYYLVAFPDATTTPSPSLSPSATATKIAAVALVGRDATPTPAPQSPTPAPATQVGDPAPGPSIVNRAAWWGIAVAALVVAVLALVFVAFKRRGATELSGPHLSGTVDLTDRETGESRQVSLFQYPHGARITRRPLGLAGLASQVASGATVAYVLPSEQGPLLYLDLPRGGGAEADTTPKPMQPGQDYKVAGGVVEVRYRPFEAGKAGSAMRQARGRV